MNKTKLIPQILLFRTIFLALSFRNEFVNSKSMNIYFLHVVTVFSNRGMPVCILSDPSESSNFTASFINITILKCFHCLYFIRNFPHVLDKELYILFCLWIFLSTFRCFSVLINFHKFFTSKLMTLCYIFGKSSILGIEY